MSILPEELLKVLACPQCKGDLILEENLIGLICEKCRLFFPIKDGIPIMLLDEAQNLDEILKKEGS